MGPVPSIVSETNGAASNIVRDMGACQIWLVLQTFVLVPQSGGAWQIEMLALLFLSGGWPRDG